MLDFKLSGIKAARENLRKVAKPVTDKRITENAMQALEPVAQEARRLVPVDSGDLRGTIGVAGSLAVGGNVANVVYVGVVRAGLRHVFYAHFIEFGTIAMRAHPFLAPAIFKHRELVFDVLSGLIAEEIVGAL